MRIVSVDGARTTWLFPITEFNSAGRSLTDVFLKIRDRYGFKKFPSHFSDTDPQTKGLVFDHGEFVNKGGVRVLVKMSIFTDGVVGDCWSSTRDSEDFLKDLFGWIKTEHDLSLPADRKIKTLYLSELTVTTDKNLELINPKLEEFARRLSARMTAEGRENRGYTVGGFSLWAKDWDRSNATPSYRFERKLGTAADDHRYYSSAALTTDDHFALLQEQEEILF